MVQFIPFVNFPSTSVRYLNLSTSVRFLKERHLSSQIMLHGIRFHLNAESLQQIQEAKAQGYSLYISARFLGDLRYYVLFDHYSAIRSTLDFVTYYHEGDKEEALMRSFISLDGDIIHQVCDTCFKEENFAIEITSAHYWLINQLLERLRFEAQNFVHNLAWCLSLLFTSSSFGLYLYGQYGSNFWGMIVNPNLFGVLMYAGGNLLLQKGIYYLIKWIQPKLKRWLVTQIISNLSSEKSLLKRFMIGWLGRFG